MLPRAHLENVHPVGTPELDRLAAHWAAAFGAAHSALSEVGLPEDERRRRLHALADEIRVTHVLLDRLAGTAPRDAV
jgi:hypothetical protein